MERGLLERAAFAGAAGWAAFEVAMAVVLFDRFEARDWAALALKLAYIAGLGRAALSGRRELLVYAAAASPVMAAAVRATGGWLGYTLFTVYLPVIGLAASTLLKSPAASAVNAAVAAAMGYGLAAGSPGGPAPPEAVAAWLVAAPLAASAPWPRAARAALALAPLAGALAGALPA